MSAQTIARRYAGALADVIVERGEAREVQEEMWAWQLMIDENSQLQEVFSNPTISYEQKGKVLVELINRTKIRPTTANFLQVVLKNQRLTELAEINQRLTQVLDQRAGVVAAQVTSARPIAEDTRATIQAKLRGLTGKDVRVSFQTDNDIIGGLVTRIGSTVYDSSIRTQLQLLSTRLARS
ncbi:MAG TPA: ATP synthase F1 subunit delta [Pyrinomonadaceae bacterium]|nr:ATP synthase F1 subunit delta [Pyrinomonadaceae bacterium]